MSVTELIESLRPNRDEAAAEVAGYNCAMVGPNTDNCDFRLFASPDLTRAWERGKARGDKARREP